MTKKAWFASSIYPGNTGSRIAQPTQDRQRQSAHASTNYINNKEYRNVLRRRFVAICLLWVWNLRDSCSTTTNVRKRLLHQNHRPHTHNRANKRWCKDIHNFRKKQEKGENFLIPTRLIAIQM